MFFDRDDAGKQLAQKLKGYTGTNAVVYAVPRGGVVTGREVSRALDVPMDIVVACRVIHPMNKECAVCAVTEDGERVCDEVGVCCLDDAWIDVESKIQQEEARRRRRVYRGSETPLSAEGRTAILVDDGVATGLSMKAVILAIQKQKPRKIVVATPVAPHRIVTELNQLVDEMVVLKDESHYKGTVSMYYKHFHAVSDKEVQAALGSVETMYNPRVDVEQV